MTRPLCIYHGNCADGFTAAWAVWKRFGDAFDYHAGVYQNPPPDVAGRDVVLVDFSYKREVMRAMRGHGAGKARSVLVLDHHKSAAEDLGKTEGNFCIQIANWTGQLTWERHLENAAMDQNEGAVDSVYCLFDMNRSGAGIAWDFFHSADTRPKLVKYAEDRDLWRFALPFSREVNAYIFAHEYDFGTWSALANLIDDETDAVVRMGAAIEKKHHKDVRELANALKRRMTIGGHEVWAASLPYTLTSDAGHLLCEPYDDGLNGSVIPPFAACYWDTPEGRVFSLRSRDGGADVSEIAKQYGGGGHRNAAGFRLPHGVEP